MSYELILEVPSTVVKVVAIDESINNLNLKSAAIILLKTGITVINNETGHVYRSFEPLKGSSHSFIDCIYLADSKSFLAVASDSSLILVPEYTKKSSDFRRAVVPFQPSSVHCYNGKDVIVHGSNGVVCQFTLTSDNSFPSFSAVAQSSQSSLLGLGNARHFTTISIGDSGEVAASSKKSRKSVVPSSSSGSGNQLTLTTWKARNLLEGSSLCLSSDKDKHQSKVAILSGETLVAACAHRYVDSISLIVHNSTSNTTRWLKVNTNGDVLIERTLASKPSSVVEVGEQLWMVHDHSRVSLWDTKFGVEVKIFTANASNVSSGGVSYVVPYGHSFNPEADVSAASVAPCQLMVSVASAGGDSTSLYRHTLTSETQTVHSSLCSAIGKMASTSAAEGENPFNVSIYDDSNQPVAATADAVGDASGANSGRVLAGLPGPMKRKLKQIQTLYDNQVKLEMSELTNTNDMDSPEERFSKRYRRFYLDIPDSVSRAFLTRLESAKHSDLQASDWDLVKVLIRSGTLSLASNPSLIEQALLAHRFDVLAQIVRYVSDLTEKQCVRILRLCLYVSDNSLARLIVVHGIIQFGNNSVAPTAKPEDNAKSGLVSIESLVTETPKGKTPKKKAAAAGSRASAKDFFVADKDAESADHVANSMAVEEQQQGGDKRSLILRAMIESVVHRSSAFSSVLLSEAVRTLSPSMCALFLRLFSHTLRGLSVPVNESKQAVHLGAFGDDQIKRAITWIEALLDGNFSAIALHASVHAPTRRALSFAMKAVSECDEAVGQVESALGLWTHITRIIYNGSEQPKPIPGLYHVEQLSF